MTYQFCRPDVDTGFEFDLPNTVVPPILREIHDDVVEFMTTYNSRLGFNYYKTVRTFGPVIMFLILQIATFYPLLYFGVDFGLLLGVYLVFLWFFGIFSITIGHVSSHWPPFYLVLRHKYNQKCKYFCT